MDNEEEKGFEVIDKRARREEPPAAGQSEQETAEAAEQAPEEQPEAGGEAITGDVYSLVHWFILMLTESAWQWMGLRVNPATKKVEKDLAQAKIAIDSVVFLSDQIAPHVPEELKREYRSMVSDLRVTFVQQSQGG